MTLFIRTSSIEVREMLFCYVSIKISLSLCNCAKKLKSSREKRLKIERMSSKEKCVPCSSLDLTAKLSCETIDEALKHDLSLWETRYDEKASCNVLSRSFTAKNFECAINYINEVGHLAEREGHHPDLHLTSYRNVEVVVYTHKVNGITGNDLALAKMIDEEIKVVYSPKWLRENPSAAITSKSS